MLLFYTTGSCWALWRSRVCMTCVCLANATDEASRENSHAVCSFNKKSSRWWRCTTTKVQQGRWLVVWRNSTRAMVPTQESHTSLSVSWMRLISFVHRFLLVTTIQGDVRLKPEQDPLWLLLATVNCYCMPHIRATALLWNACWQVQQICSQNPSSWCMEQRGSCGRFQLHALCFVKSKCSGTIWFRRHKSL